MQALPPTRATCDGGKILISCSRPGRAPLLLLLLHRTHFFLAPTDHSFFCGPSTLPSVRSASSRGRIRPLQRGMLLLLAAPLVAVAGGFIPISRSAAVRTAAAAAAAAASSAIIVPPASASYTRVLPDQRSAILTNPSVSSGVALYDARVGKYLPADPQRQLRAALPEGATPRVFFVGEEHRHQLHHAFQVEMIKAVDALDEAPTLIGLEMCWRQHQPALDAFVFGDKARGGGDLAKLAERTNWAKTWGYPIELYAEVLNYARDRRLRLCGLNTPYAIIDTVARVGLDRLPPEVRG